MKRLVIKVGSAVLRHGYDLAIDRLNNLVDLIAALKREKNYEIILVSSGAVAAGNITLDLDKTQIYNRQALAAIGQPLLLKHYKKQFNTHNYKCAQMLLVADDFDSRKRTKNIKAVMEILLKNNITPIVNENDVIANEELLFGDNDQLAANVAHAFNADLLVILSDVEGFYDDNPHHNTNAKIIKEVSFIKDEELEVKHSANSEFATGGIVTKLKAAKFLMDKDIPMFLTSGFNLKTAHEYLLEDKHESGTLFKA